MVLAVGIMSGTSLDGIDTALVEITGVLEKTRVKLVDFATKPYPKELLNQLHHALEAESVTVQQVSSLNFQLALSYAAVVKELCEQNQLTTGELAYVASHGQTLFHQPETLGDFPPSTLQLGDAGVLAQLLQCTVVSNFREADMAVGGQGAPIVPFADFYCYQGNKDRILQNIGGIGNLTWIKKGGSPADVVAFDTGPGNMVINELTRHFYDEAYDHDGKHAANGQVLPELVNHWLSLPYFAQPYPKTTGRELFGKTFVAKIIGENFEIAPDDLIASATMLTAKSITQACAQLTTEPCELIIAGGGAYNPVMMAMIRQTVDANFIVKTQEDLGFSSDAKEAIAMVILAQHTLQKIPNNVPSATGARKPVVLGRVTWA
ncbi:anhydro-N-acetylmuramic acid kinase [Enterococcus diestrammenae]|uniref:anhydro-N-acetylmuramic acid kinase n=1 Tax=Enterococcus diestrammenae TaxID=1155073 RepID=UPI0019593843